MIHRQLKEFAEDFIIQNELGESDRTLIERFVEHCCNELEDISMILQEFLGKKKP